MTKKIVVGALIAFAATVILLAVRSSVRVPGDVRPQPVLILH